jgi:hypothetical protein
LPDFVCFFMRVDLSFLLSGDMETSIDCAATESQIKSFRL